MVEYVPGSLTPGLTFILVISFAYFLALKLWLALQYQFLTWDSYVYLLNARVFLLGHTAPNFYFELLRPPLLPYMVALLWTATGESIPVAALVQPVLTVAAAAVLYKLGAKMFSVTAGVFSAVVFLIAPITFLWTNQILTHGVAAFFLALAVYSLWRGARGEPRFYALAGVVTALGALARYTGVLVAIVGVVFVAVMMLIGRRPREEGVIVKTRELKWMILGIVLFVLCWAPWLAWNYVVNGNLLGSILSGLSVGTEVGPDGPWYYYLVNLPAVLSLPGVVLLVFGLVSKRISSDRWLIITWLLAYLLFYSVITNKQPRFYVDWFLPLALLMGVGFDGLLTLFRRHSRLRRLVLLVTVVWLASLSYTAFQTSSQDAVYDNYFFESRGLLVAAGWAMSHMNTTDIGASNFAPHLSYYSHRDFLSVASLFETARARGISPSQIVAEAKVKYVMVTSDFAQENHLDSQAAFGSITTAGDFRVYELLNMTRSPRSG